MRKLRTLIAVGVAACAMGLGVVVGTHHSEVAKVEAGTETTVYYAVPSNVVGSYTVKFNAKLSNSDWHSGNMTKLDETFGGCDLYSYTYTDLYDGVDVMQFQLYNGGDWVSQQEPFGIWTPASTYNGKIYVHDDGWYSYDSLDKYIPMTKAFFTNWTDAAGSIADADARFWGENYSFEALSPFYRGETAEGWTGTLTSITWKQSTQYVYFQLGGARDYDHANGHAHLVFHYGPYSADFYNNTFVENPMTLRYFKVPDDKFAELTENSNDFDMYVEVVDPAWEGYGFVNLGYFHINQTEESTSDAMRYFLNHLSDDSREWKVNNRRSIFNSYFDNADQRAVFFRTVSDISDSFSTNEDFMKHWYFDHNYFEGSYDTKRHVDKAIGTDTFRPDDNYSSMPFNNNGGFFRGWYEGSLDSGFVAADNLRYRFISRPFVLSGSGIVSIKMAGKASLHVIDATSRNSLEQPADLAWIDNKALQMDGAWNNMAASGFNTTAMVRHVINLEAYVGKTIQLAICDKDYEGWSAAYFDDLVTDYSSSLGFKVEYATQANNSGTFYPVFRDIYINSACINDGNQYGIIYNGKSDVNTANGNAILNHVDSSTARSAYEVWNSYIETVRGGKAGNNYCSALVSDGVKAVLNSFNSLSSEAKTIVCDSDDFEVVGGVPTIYGPTSQYKISRSLAYLGDLNGIDVGIAYNNASFLAKSMDRNSGTIAVIIVALVSVTTLGLLLVIKKRKFLNK